MTPSRKLASVQLSFPFSRESQIVTVTLEGFGCVGDAAGSPRARARASVI